MNQEIELYDKVVYYKGRVWTIYALTGNNDGVFAYHGLKPYGSFRYDSDRSDRSISYFSMKEVLGLIVEDKDKIAECVEAEKIAQAKKLNKKMAVEFLVHLTGHTKTKINNEIEDNHNRFTILLGRVHYDLSKINGRLQLQHNMHGRTTNTTFDFVTWKHDSMYDDARKQEQDSEDRKEAIENYKHRYNCSCDQK